ncbi:glycosyltransferase family 2 protein [Agromyces italicus]|uniref:glycosyltransferase family 2 protein n=1 Tax=Agromyces italicus TaxID=279572 RepID=UPI0003B7AEDC|nr:glycosyltransferase [Agromyces italicus]
MFPRVTAVLVVHHGGDHLRQTLDALHLQERMPDALVVVLTEADDVAREQVAAASPSHLVDLSQHLSFGEAIRAADRVLEAPGGDADALWLLAEDSAPAPDALAQLVASLETAKSVAVAGPKLVDWDEPERIVRFGRSITRLGRSVAIVTDELDQGQHDGLSDVLVLDPAAILVRHTVLRALGGFDPGLPTVDDALDLSIRARLAGHRVAVVPEAKVRFAGVGVAGPEVGPRARTTRRRVRATRAAQLHRRLVYAPLPFVPLHWLSFLLLAVVRSVRLLLVKAPGAIPGEFAAAFTTMFSGARVPRARRALKSARTVGWSAIAPLRMQPDEMRRRRQHSAEARRERARGRKHELQFIGTGGGWILLATAAASVGLFSWLLGSGGVGGGALQPLSGDVAELWRNAAYGWRDLGTGFVGAADPFAGVLAVIGSAAFWAPSFALLVLWLLAIPAAAVGAWFAASRLTERASVRAVAALLWAFAPPFLVALGDGRPGAVLAHVLLAWFAFAAFGAATSWAAAATASLLLAALVGAAPSLVPALLVAWVVALALSGRAWVRLIGLPIPALVLALPLVADQLRRGTPLGLLADPGLPVGSEIPTIWQLALGLPDGGWGGWDSFFSSSGSVDFRIALSALVLPLVLVALAAVLTRTLRPAALALGIALLGFATAVAAAHLAVGSAGAHAIPIWTGAGLSLAWLGLVLAAVLALDAMRRGRALLGWVVFAAMAAAVLPTGVALATGAVAVQPAAARTLPAFVGAEAETDPRVTTLRLTPDTDGSLRATLERGTGTTLDDQSTLAATERTLSAEEEELALVAGNLASRSGADAEAAVREFGASFVLLDEPADPDDTAAVAIADRARTALDANSALVAVGETDFGTLWRFTAAEPDAPAAQIPAGAGGWMAGVVTAVQLLVLGATLLLSIPTGAGREADRRPERRRPVTPSRRKERTAAEGAQPGSDAEQAVATDDAEAGSASVETAAEAPEPEAPEPETPEPEAPEPETPEPEAPEPETPEPEAPEPETPEPEAPEPETSEPETGPAPEPEGQDEPTPESEGDDDGR